MGLFDLGEKIANFVRGEVDTEKKQQGFNTIEKLTGIKIDDKQRTAMIKANVPVDQLIAAYTLKQIQGAASNARGSQSLNQLGQPGGLQAAQQQLPGGGSITQGGVTATIPQSLGIDQQKANIEVGKEVGAQAGKAGQLAGRDLASADLKISGLLDNFIDYADRQKEISGIDPGPLSGTISKVINNTTRLNEFQSGLEGAAIEVAAASAKASMPGIRGVQSIKLFQKAVVNPFDTIESGVVNSAYSYQNALTSDMAASPDNYVKGYNKMSPKEKVEARKEMHDMAVNFQTDYINRFYKSAFKKQIQTGREILKPETTQSVLSSLPKYASTQEGDKASKPGDLYIVNGQLVEAS